MHVNDADLARFIKGDIEDEKFESILEHLEECGECRKRYQALLYLKTLSPEEEKFKKWNRFYLIAASVVIFLTATVFLTSIFLKREFKSNFFLYVEKNYYPYEKSETRGPMDEEEFRSIMALYAEGKFNPFKRRMENYLKKKMDVRGAFYLGVVYYIGREYNKAERYLKVSTENFSPEIYPERFWYLANTYILEGKKEKAKPILEELGSFENPYKKGALKLLKSIE